MRYDVVIAGGSFAGLVLATSLRGRVALIEKGAIGSGQTSACGTTLDLVQKLDVEDCIEEIHHEAVLHTSSRSVRFRLPYAFCTFDYRRFCELLVGRFNGDLVRGSATGVDGDRVLTTAGDVEGAILVDATGWRAALATSADPGFPATTARSYGLEQPVVGFDDDGLHFYFDDPIRGDGYAWAFPAGPVARAGVLSYVAADGVAGSTSDFIRELDARAGQWHGGYLPAGLRPATAAHVFAVGDAAGHCLPLTGEGIRPAAFFAQQLALLLKPVIAGRQTTAEAAAMYAQMQARFARRYRFLRAAQRTLRGWPDPPLGPAFSAFARGLMYRYLTRVYWEVAAPILPTSSFGPAAIEEAVA
ncbi:MAG: NAD(P)/FAD-dependent oxidoreductase [Candidatus Dormibacteria bacterium]